MGNLTSRKEVERLSALASFNIDTVSEPVFDSLTELAAQVCGTPMAIMSLIDEHRQWFKSRFGVEIGDTPREIAFCAHTIDKGRFFEVKDTLLDPRFKTNPLVVNDPRIRFYAGAPLLTNEGYAIGSLAVLDVVPRELSADQQKALVHMARHAVLQLELRRIGWESGERYRALIEACPSPIVTFDLSGNVVMINPAAEALFGWKSEEVTGKPNPLVPKAEWGNYEALLAQLGQQQSAVQLETRRITRQGREVEVIVSAAPLRSFSGDVTGGMAILHDITAHKERDSRLQESYSLVEATLDSTTDGMLVVDRKGKIVAHNRRFCEIWRLEDGLVRNGVDAEALEKAVTLLKNPSEFMEKVRHLYAHPEQDSFDVLELNDGRILERYSQPQRIANHIVGRVWSFRDVTQRVELEAQLRQSQKMEAVGALAGGVAHDFNNLLNIIIGYNSLLAANIPPESTEAMHSDKIRQAAERAAALTRQLLAFSRRQVLRPQVLNVNDSVRGLAQMVPRILREDIDFKLRLSEETLLVHADPGQIEQVLMNLIVNARDAMPMGGELSVETNAAAAEAQHWVELVVSDTGHGIDPGVLPRIFEPFFTTKPTGSGTGLGLSTAYGIIQQSGGTLSATSEVGRGSTFTVRLPRYEQAQPELAVVARRAHARGMGESILVVEDESALRALIVQILRTSGYRVIEAPTPEEALEILGQRDVKIDLVLTDVIMPHLSGSQLASRALEIRPGLRIAFMSGYPEQDIELQVDGAALIEKPFSPQALLEHIRTLLEVDANVEEDRRIG